MKIILDKAALQLEKNLPFVVYKKPESQNCIGFFQKNDALFELENFSEKGFAFATFNGNQKYIIPANQSEIVSAIWENAHENFVDNELKSNSDFEKIKFTDLVAKGIKSIENNEFNKVVLSRKETVNLNRFDLIDVFKKLLQLYSSSFVYCFFHPKLGTWLGATPELLLKAEDSVFETVSLAGTQKHTNTNKIIWHNKEIAEQLYVTDYIVTLLDKVATKVRISKPYNIKAGNIWHIKTNISGVLNSSFGLKKIIELLHPTPAVCGLPMDKAKDFILENENYERTFYTGFLGELNIENKTELFVNLRCMEIEIDSKLAKTQAHLFMGCGITKDSIPEKEWEESVNKSFTMKRVLEY
ncbi:chorismate-binding protein [Flavobacterium sp.]|uniref:chorismate-binding protein n=1 Tax=Flavobacterium sp. TaxID=239 RepID=UPI00286A5592|nr:chorismate-binding protein [Flavobacterium sp.]